MRIQKTLITIFIFSILIQFLIHSSLGAQTPVLTINIDNPKFRPMIVAITPYSKSELGNQLSKELDYLLNFSGFFKTVPASTFDSLVNAELYKFSQQSSLSSFDYQTWKKLGIETLIIGQLSEASASKATLHLKAIDLYGMRSLAEKTYSNMDRSKLMTAQREFGDILLQRLTNRSGLFNSKVVFSARRSQRAKKQIYISDFDGRNVEQITFDDAIHISPSWSPDGLGIVYTKLTKTKPTLHIYDSRSKRHRLLSSVYDTNSGGAFTPDGKSIAFSGSREGNADIHLVPAGGGTVSNFIQGSGDDVDPSFSPDGKWVAFVSSRFGNPHIFRGELTWSNGIPKITNDKRLTYAGWYNTGPAWTPESDKLVFAGYDKDINRYDIFMMEHDGNKLERLTLRTGDNEDPSWSPNGQLVIFQSNRVGSSNLKGQYHLYIMNRDGSQQRRIMNTLYESEQPDWGPNMPYSF